MDRRREHCALNRKIEHHRKDEVLKEVTKFKENNNLFGLEGPSCDILYNKH